MIMTLLPINHDNLCDNNTYPHGDINFPFQKNRNFPDVFSL